MRRLAKWFRKLSSVRPTAARPRPVARLTLESLEERAVPSVAPVAPNAAYPYTSVCKMYMWFPDGKEFVGSGAVVDSFHVLTAGHCVYSYADGGWASRVEVVPEMSGSSRPFGDAWMTRERTYTTWENASKSHPGQTGPGDMDIALVTLDRNIGTRTGWMAIGYDGSSSYNLNTAGYPAASPYSGQTMYWDYARGTVSGSNIYYGDPAVGGQSGSPLWSYYPSTGKRIIRGVLVGSNGISTRITSQVFNDFVSAMNSDARPATTSAAATATASAPLSGHAAAPAPFLGPDAGGRLLASVTGGGSSRDLVRATDALFAAQPATVPAATGPADAAALPALAAKRHHRAGDPSPVLDELRSDSLTPDLADL